MAIENGDKVSVHYTGRLKDGKEFDSSRGREPLNFTLGEGMLIPGFEEAVKGRAKGDKFTVEIKPEKGYGDSDPDLVFTVRRRQMPEHIPLEVGTAIQLSNEQGQMDAVITAVGSEEITLDANHPLAGKDMVFEIEILDHKPGGGS